jgi:hypothetical protein
MFNKLLVMCAVILFSVSVIFAGDAVCDEEKEMRGYFSIGGTTIDLDDLNTRLNNKGYSEPSDGLFSIGGGIFQKVSPNVLFGVEGGFLIGDQADSDIGGKKYSSSILGGYGLLNTAILAYESDNFEVYPVFGMGLGGINVKVGQSSFDAILDNPQRAASMGTMSFLLNVGLETDWKIALSGDNSNDDFFYIGLRGGYLFAPFSSGWYMDEMSLTGDPDGGMTGPYLRLTIGGGGQFMKSVIKNTTD